jgi:hypothetical protein
MKIKGKKFILQIYSLFIASAFLHTLVSCSQKEFMPSKAHQKDRFLSSSYNHFENGILFTDVEAGLEVLWKASFKDGNVYKENLGFFVNGGLLILPNKYNTCTTARPTALETKIHGGKLHVKFAGNFTEVLSMIHTHPDVHTRREPTPRNDYQYCYSGIHNYVMDHLNLFDAYKDAIGREVYDRLGPRDSYHKIPIVRETIDQFVSVYDLESNDPD